MFKNQVFYFVLNTIGPTFLIIKRVSQDYFRVSVFSLYQSYFDGTKMKVVNENVDLLYNKEYVASMKLVLEIISSNIVVYF